MKKGQQILALTAMIFVVIVVLLTSFQVAVYGDKEYGFYRDMYEECRVTDDLDMEIGDVMDVTEHMMAYLIGEEEELSVITDVDGKEQDFFNEQDRLHMADVKGLFLTGLLIRNILAGAAALLILILVIWKADIWRLLRQAYVRALLVTGALAAVVVAGCMVDFTACFTLFHKIFFTNDLWLFDPAEDYMIRMLPEKFFFHMAGRIGIFFAAGAVIIMLLLVICRRAADRKEA